MPSESSQQIEKQIHDMLISFVENDVEPQSLAEIVTQKFQDNLDTAIRAMKDEGLLEEHIQPPKVRAIVSDGFLHLAFDSPPEYLARMIMGWYSEGWTHEQVTKQIIDSIGEKQLHDNFAEIDTYEDQIHKGKVWALKTESVSLTLKFDPVHLSTKGSVTEESMMTQQTTEVQAPAQTNANGAAPTEAPAAAEAPVAAAEASGPFDLDALLTKIEQASAKTTTGVRRQLVGYLGGLIDDAGYKKLRKELVKKHGVAETDMEAFDTYTGTEACNAAWLAFCDYSYNASGTPAEIAAKYGAEEVHLNTMINANVLGLFANWKSWPKKGQLK